MAPAMELIATFQLYVLVRKSQGPEYRSHDPGKRKEEKMAEKQGKGGRECTHGDTLADDRNPRVEFVCLEGPSHPSSWLAFMSVPL